MESLLQCPCGPPNAVANNWCVSECFYCCQCQALKCPLCLIPQSPYKTCSKCKQQYEVGDQSRGPVNVHDMSQFFCSRCYCCPICDHNLDTRVEVFTRTSGGQLVLLKDRSSKVYGKRVILSCHKCGYKFNTPLETKPQGLTTMVKIHTKSEDERRFEKLSRVISDVVKNNAESRIRNKARRGNLSERRDSIISKEQKDYDDDQRENIIEALEMSSDNKDQLLKPLPKVLSTEFRERQCIGCLDTVTDWCLASRAPTIIPVLPFNYSVNNDNNDIVAVLLNVINKSKETYSIQILKSEQEYQCNMNYELIGIPMDTYELPKLEAPLFSSVAKGENANNIQTSDMNPKSIPTSVLPLFLSSNPKWEKELALRPAQCLHNVTYQTKWMNFTKVDLDSNVDQDMNLNLNVALNDFSGKIIDKDANWITILLFIKRISPLDKPIEFPLHALITNESHSASIKLQYHCIINSLNNIK